VAFEWGPLKVVAKATNQSSLFREAVKEYNSFSEHIAIHKGRVTQVKILKDLHSRTKLACVGVISHDMSLANHWISPRADTGLPKVLPSLSKLVGGDKWAKRLACSLTSQVESMRLPPSHDIRTITDPSTARPQELALWSLWCEDYSKRHWKQRYPDPDKDIKYHTSTSAGPNGGASLVSSIYDALLLMESQHREQFYSWCSTFQRDDLIKMLMSTSKSVSELRFRFKHLNKIILRKSPLHLAKLLYLPDKAGKTRIVYCLSWWIQEILHPIHHGLYKLLYTIKQDGTKSHSEAAAIVKQWTAEGRKLWSIDLTAATDRFPKELQVAVMKGILGSEKASAWSQIMAIKPWSEFHESYIEYRVGQPMGAKTSWAIFALTHHTVLRLLCLHWKTPENPYVIIGDDIVIANDNVAKSYIGLLDDLGVPYSKGKTIFPKEGDQPSAEFAKRIFSGGVELSPLTSSLVDRVWKYKDFPVFLSVLEELKVKWESEYCVDKQYLHISPPASQLFDSLPSEWRNCLTVSICKDTPVIADNSGNNMSVPSDWKTYGNPWVGHNDLVYYTALGEVVTGRVQKYVDQLTEINSYKVPLQGLPGDAPVGRILLHIDGSPLKTVVSRVEEVTKRVYRAISEGDVNLQMIMDLGLDLSYMVSLIRYGRSWESHKRLLERRNKSTINLWMDVLEVCKHPFGKQEEIDWSDW
jgi:hypothetical protein